MTRRAVVTGAASGIGLAATNRFYAEGWSVMGIDRVPAPAEKLEETRIAYVQADIRDRAAVRDAIDAFCGKEGLDALVNNAAVQSTGPTLEQSDETWHEVMSVNVVAASNMIAICRDHLRRAHGAVVNVASVHALATSAGIGVYAASKGALVALTRALAIELGEAGIRVNAVLPGAVHTAMLEAGLARSGLKPEVALTALAERTALGRVGEPGEIATAIEFLADGRRSSFMTGSLLVVDGGATIRLSTE